MSRRTYEYIGYLLLCFTYFFILAEVFFWTN